MINARHTRASLKLALAEYNLSTDGKKTEMIRRLNTYVDSKRQHWDSDIVYENQINLKDTDEIYLGTRYNKINSNGLIRYVYNKPNYDMYIDRNLLKMYLITNKPVPSIVVETIINIYESKEHKKTKTPHIPLKSIPRKYNPTNITSQSPWFRNILYNHQVCEIDWMKRLEQSISTQQQRYKHLVNNNEYKCFTEFDKSIVFNVQDHEIHVGSKDNQRFHYMKTQGGILSDAVGLGKTLTIIGLIIENHVTQTLHNKIDPIKFQMYPDTNVTLVICPSYLVSQWSNEIMKHVDPPLKHCVITGKKQHQELSYKDILTCDVVLVSDKFIRSSYYTEHNTSFSELQLNHDDPLTVCAPNLSFVEWRRIVLDEGHMTLSSHCMSMTAKYKWYVSGTPVLSNLLYEFLGWNIDYQVKPYIRSFVLARRKQDVTINIPNYRIVNKEIEMSFFETHIYESCKQVYSKLMLRQLCGTILVNPAFKHNKEYNVTMFHDHLTTHNRNMIDTLRDKLAQKTRDINYFNKLLAEPGVPEEHVHQIHTNIKRLTSDMEAIQMNTNEIERTNTYQDNVICELKNNKISCSICYEQLCGDTISITSCCHFYCDACIAKINTCSICRNPFTLTKLNTNSTMINQYGSKIACLIEYINRFSGDKIVVYSQWGKNLGIIDKCLTEQGIPHVLFNNNLSKNQTMIAQFNDDVDVILLSSQTNYCGLDLYKSKHIIFMDKLFGKPEKIREIEKQMIGRAYRIGQTESVHVVRMILKNTIES
jgi:SNF2 family DNA or RNA helicase